MSRIFNRRFAPLFGLLACLWAMPAHATGEPAAEAALQKYMDGAIAIIADESKPQDERVEDLRRLLHEAVAVRRIGLYVLGPYARRADKGLRAELLGLLEDYMITIYARRMLAFNIAEVEMNIISSRKKGSKGKEAIVATEFSGGDFNNPVKINWWLVKNKKGVYQIFNLGFEGLWVAQEQRASFASVIQRGGGEISALAAFLRKAISEAASLAQEQDEGE